MAITSTIPCPGCTRELQFRAGYVGRRVSCKFCGYEFRIPSHVFIPCPDCGKEGRAKTEVLGYNIRCKDCGHEFRAEAAEWPGSQRSAEAVAVADAELASLRHEAGILTQERDEAEAQRLALDVFATKLQDERNQLREELTAARLKIAALESLGGELAAARAKIVELEQRGDSLTEKIQSLLSHNGERSIVEANHTSTNEEAR